MRRVRYHVACSLDGYIAGPQGEYDWIVAEPEIDFGELFAEFDTLLMGRRTYEVVRAQGSRWPGMHNVVFSRTLDPGEHRDVRLVSDRAGEVVAELKAQPGKDIWLFGGGELFRSLLEIGCVDTVEPAIIPVLLGGGIPFLPAPAARCSLQLTGHRLYRSGIVWLQYAVQPASVARPPARRRTRPARSR